MGDRVRAHLLLLRRTRMSIRNEFRNCFFAPHLRQVPVDSGPLGASIFQWQLPPSSWHWVSSSTSSSCSSSICCLAFLRLDAFLVVIAVAPVGN